jgi:hypothetical protein
MGVRRRIPARSLAAAVQKEENNCMRMYLPRREIPGEFFCGFGRGVWHTPNPVPARPIRARQG